MTPILTDKMDTTRRALIGLILGLVVIGLFAALPPSAPQVTDMDSLDQEIITLSPAPKPLDEIENVATAGLNDEKAARYSFFAKNKRSLTSAQRDAIVNETPILSIVINHVGQQRALTQKIAESLPKNVTIALSPHLNGRTESVSTLQNAGFELWMTMAAITLNMNTDSSDFALTPTNNFEFNINILSDQISDQDYLTGVILPPQALIKRSGKLWDDLVYDIFGQGYGLLDDTDGIVKPTLYFYDDHRAPYLSSDAAMDDLVSLQDFSTLLNSIRDNTLSEKRYILSLPLLTPGHLDILAEWLDALSNDRITLVPLSAQAQL